ncbi:MAG: hypothetical protein E6375_03560, partial [Dermabacter sp.]|nr:hypothetical protein [Dermabacter sp.]
MGEVETTIPVSYGTKEEQVFDFTDLGAFKDGNARAAGSLEPAKGENGEDPAVRMQFDFTRETATRGYYLIANEPVTLEGNAISFSADVKGDSNGVWPRLEVIDAKGTKTNINGDNITFDGWSKVVFNVPEGLAQPLTVNAVRLMETRPGAKYKGDVTIANLTATTTTAVEAEAGKAIHDPALLTVGSVADRPQRVAVMSDAQFVARDPKSPSVEGARRTLREIKAAKPDLLVINGDFVDEATPEDFDRPTIDVRRAAQADLNLPKLPTTTIGSFPQTAEIRRRRAEARAGKISAEELNGFLRDEIASVIKLQEELGLDVLVHGEAERNDMVQYFAENFDGFATTRHGWVQSYGSRCTRPSILFGDVKRHGEGLRGEAFTVPWSSHAQSLSDKPVKGMLT